MKRLLAYLFIVLGLGLTFSVSTIANIKCFNPKTNKVETWNSYDYCPGNRVIYESAEDKKKLKIRINKLKKSLVVTVKRFWIKKK